MKSDKPRTAPVISIHILDYKLTKEHRKLFDKFDELLIYMRQAGKSPPCMRLMRADYKDLDAKVRQQSDGKQTLDTVKYGIYPIKSALE